MSPAEKVLAWLGSAGAVVRIYDVPDDWTEVEGQSDDSPRSARIGVTGDNSDGMRASTLDVAGPKRLSTLMWTVHGEAGVRYLARWLVDGGPIDSPHIVAYAGGKT